MRRIRCLVLCCLVVAVGACGDGIDEGVNEGRGARGTIDGVTLHTPDSVAVTTPPDEPTSPSIDAAPSGDDAFGWTTVTKGVEEGRLEVPLDYANPTAGTVSLYVERHRARVPSERIGTLLVNPGGPGFGGSSLAEHATDVYGPTLLDRFDIVGWDPRGTGFSEPAVNCVRNDDRYFSIDSSPDDTGERQRLIDLATEFARACATSNGDLLPHLGTADSARDMDSIRAALGEPRISYFGFSYGSELGATWATMFPDTVRATVLDGAVDPTVGAMARDLQQAVGFEQEFDRFLSRCSARASCPFHSGGDSAGAFDRLQAAVDRRPVPAKDAKRPPVSQGVLDTAVTAALYDRSFWPQLEQALADLAAGDGTAVLDLYDGYYGYSDGTWDDATEAYFAIGCLDDPGSSGPFEVFAHEAQFAAAAPRLGRSWVAELTFCSVWPVHGPKPVTITGGGAGQIVVVGTTGDAATPLVGTRTMARTLEDGRLVVVRADQHTGYGVSQCGDDAIEGYLVDPSAPLPAETDC